MKEIERAEIERAEIEKLTLLVNLDEGYFNDFTGEEQISYIFSLDDEERSVFLLKKYYLIKKDAPAPKSKCFMNKTLIAFFIERQYPFNIESEFDENANMSYMDFSKTNITAKQFLQAKKISYCTLPKMDFSDCSFEGKDISNVDFSNTNITGEQFLQAKEILYCTLPKMDFSDCSFEGKDISNVDFSKTNITAKQLLQADCFVGVKLPDGLDFSDCSFESMDLGYIDFGNINIEFSETKGTKLSEKDKSAAFNLHDKNISNIDFSHAKLSGKQFSQARRAFNCILPKDIDFAGCSFKNKELRGVDFSHTNFSGKQYCEAFKIIDCKLPAGIDFTGCNFKGKIIAEIDFRESNISLEQIREARFMRDCIFPDGLGF